MADRLPIYYWDTCIFLERLRGEKITPPRQRAVQQILDDNKDKKNRIMTSVLTHAEAIPRKITEFDVATENEYWSYFDGVYFLDFEISRSVILLSRELRNHYYCEADPKRNVPYRMLGLGDSIHLASAIIAGADELHTRDRRPSGGNLGLLGLPLLHAGGLIGARWKLNIVSPEDAQSNLLDATVPGAT